MSILNQRLDQHGLDLTRSLGHLGLDDFEILVEIVHSKIQQLWTVLFFLEF